MEDEILCIIDMQVDFVTGALKNSAAEAIIPKIVKRIDSFDGALIVATRDTHDINYLHTLEGEKLPVEHCLENTPGHCIVPEISDALIRAQRRGIKVRYVNKNTFGLIDLKIYLDIPLFPEAIPQITLVGTCTGICVLSNAIILKASFPDTPIRVIAEECACVSSETHKTALAAMHLTQIDID